jgi:hypothetical protein
MGSAGQSFVVEDVICFASHPGDRIPDELKEKEDNKKMNWRKRGNQEIVKRIGS